MRIGLGLNLRQFSLASLDPYLGQVATRSNIADSTLAQTKIMSRRAMYATEAFTSFKIKFPGWYSIGSDISASVGSAVTYHASIEYPAGTFTEVKWATATTVVAPLGGDTGLSDAITVAIPSGAKFYVRVYATTTASGIPVNTQDIWAAGGDACVSDGTAVDQVLSGTVTQTGGNFLIAPLCVVQTTTKPSFLLVGDSRTGSTTNASSDGGVGQFGFSMGTGYGWVNAGISGSALRGFVTSGPLRRALSQYVSHVINGYGINDFSPAIGNRSAAQVQADFTTTALSMPDKVHILATVSPYTTSTDSWATLANQTVFGREADRLAFNTWARAVPDGFSACIDIASAIETSGKWTVGTTSDGLHQNASGNAAILSANVVNPASRAALVSLHRWTPFKYATLDWFDAANAATSTASNGSLQVLAGTSLGGTGVLSTTTFNGGPSYSLTGAAEYMYYSPSATDQNAPGFLFGMQWMPTTNPAANASIGGYMDTSGGIRAMIMQDTAGHPGIGIKRLDGDTAVIVYSATTMTLNQAYLLTCRFDPTTGTANLYVDGVLAATATYGSTGNTSNTTSQFAIMGYLGGKSAYGRWREFLGIQVPTATDAERQKMEGFLAWKSGINTTNLPSGHPYYAIRPTL